MVTVATPVAVMLEYQSYRARVKERVASFAYPERKISTIVEEVMVHSAVAFDRRVSTIPDDRQIGKAPCIDL